jgi:hypothetical protein
MRERLRNAEMRERTEVLLALSNDPMPTQQVRRAAGLDTVHINRTLGHLRKLRSAGLAVRWSDRWSDGWLQTWPAGRAADEMLRVVLGRAAASGGGDATNG